MDIYFRGTRDYRPNFEWNKDSLGNEEHNKKVLFYFWRTGEESKKEGKDHESTQSSTTPDPFFSHDIRTLVNVYVELVVFTRIAGTS